MFECRQAAAALGNTVSDVVGVALSSTIQARRHTMHAFVTCAGGGSTHWPAGPGPHSGAAAHAPRPRRHQPRHVRRPIHHISLTHHSHITQLYQQYQREQAAVASQQQRMSEEAAKQVEQDFERRIRENARAMAEQDKQRRALEVDQRKREAEMRLQAELERQRVEEELRRQAEEKLRAARSEAERKRAEVEATRVEEARKNKAQWDEQERRRQEAKLGTLPEWQQNLIANKRRQGSS